MGLQTGGPSELYRDWHWTTLGLSDFGFAQAPPTLEQQQQQQASDGETFSSEAGGGGASSSTTSSLSNNNLESNSLSSYLMDGNVRAMLKKVTVNEGALNQTIQSLGGGEKGLKELMGYIMSWVREQNSDLAAPPAPFQYPSPPPVAAPFEYAGFGEFYQPCTKARRVGDRSDVHGVPVTPFEYGYQQQPQFQQVPSPVSSAGGLFSYTSGSYGGGGDLTRTMTATNTRAARKNRIARQRQQSLPRHASAPAAWAANPPALSIGMFPLHCPSPHASSTAGAAKVQNADMLTFLLQKELRPSDVGNLGRIILPKKEAEMHLPILALREGVLLQMEDFDSGHCWNIRYRFWPNNKSRMYLLENTGEFVKQHHLQEGDLLILYRNQQGNYVLRGKKKVLLESRGGAQMKFAHSLARGFPEASTTTTTTKTEEEVIQQNNNNNNNNAGVLKLAVTTEPSTPATTNVVKAEPSVLVDDDDPFFKEDVMHNIGSTFGPGGILQPLERFPSLSLDFPFDEIMAGVSPTEHKDEDSESSKSSVKSEPTG